MTEVTRCGANVCETFAQPLEDMPSTKYFETMRTPQNLGMISAQRLTRIPRHLRRTHEASFFFHDRIVLAMKEIDSLGPRIRKFTIRSMPAVSRADLDAMDGISFARAVGEPEIAKDLLLGECILALMADALNYICEALFCYEKGKIGVSLSLMRKPMKENLLFLEWILADDEAFCSAFAAQDRKQMTIEALPPERRKEIILGALAKADTPVFHDAAFLYDLRYNKGFNGLEPLWQKAQHLTTTQHASVRTEPENFNFIFANPDNIRGIYDRVGPLYLVLIIHFFDVASAAIRRTYPLHEGSLAFDQICKAAALAFSNRSYRQLGKALREVMDVCKEHVRCECGGKPELTPATLARALFARELYCLSCGEPGPFDLYKLMGFADRTGA